jgi:signal transduction histidine kinase
MATAFTEQAAIAIEHAHLYQAAQEHELFSQALANIAARLNNAIAPELGIGAGIHQLICTESANALQADYALLYIIDPNSNLVPLAIYTSEQEPASMLNEWPTIRPNEYEAQALSSLQPILTHIDSSTTTDKLSTVSGKLSPLYSQQSISSEHPARPPISGLRGRRASSLREALLRRFVHTAILAPLITRDTPVGLLVLARSLRPGTRDKKSFALADLPQAQDFAEQAAVAFTNAQLYSQLRNAHQRLQELDELKDQFMITASHELRTPLTAVQGYLELLAEYGDSLPHDQRQEFLQKARRGCDELVLLLSNVMDVSRLEVEAGIRPAYIERVSIQDMIQNAIDLIEPHLTQEQREVHVYVPPHLFVQADPTRLRQVLLNISVNALKYSPPGTPITFSARGIYDHIPCAIISVTDRGKGIKPQDQAQLFQRFVRLESDMNSSVRGSGLGLYISRRLVEAMGGKIWIESTGIAGAGSTFHIQLPLASLA